MLDNNDRPERRTALIAKELESLNIDIAALQETRRETQGQIEEKGYSFYWIGKKEGRRDAGVTFAINTLTIRSRHSRLRNRYNCYREPTSSNTQ